MRIIILDGAEMTDRDVLHGYLKRELRFPEYYGNNLDALADCLSELGPHNHIILTNAETLRTELGEYGERLIEVFKETASPGAYHFAIDGE